MSADIERHAYRPGGNLNRCAECYCPRSHSIHQVTAHEAHIAAIGGRCSHGGHGWEDTCSDIDGAPFTYPVRAWNVYFQGDHVATVEMTAAQVSPLVEAMGLGAHADYTPARSELAAEPGDDISEWTA